MTTVRTVMDPRVVDEQGVVMNQYVGPLNWEHYKIPASGLSNSQITFANIVTLGTNRIYDSNFEIEYTLQILVKNPQVVPAQDENYWKTHLSFNAFPLHSVTDQLRCNINGSACMSRPQESLFQRMMYWRQSVLDKTCSFCPHDKPTLGHDPSLTFANDILVSEADRRFANDMKGNGRSQGKPLPCVSFNFDSATNIITVVFREPVLCPPFNQRLDKIYQRPIFNVTSIDIVYQLNDLRKMILMLQKVLIQSDQDDVPYWEAIESGSTISNDLTPRPSAIQVNITSAQLCFNVASLPPGMTVPPYMTLPYYDNVNYVTQATNPVSSKAFQITSGVYTLAQIPTAIYIFASENQLFRSQVGTQDGINPTDYAPSLCPIRDINITMGNNTQLLATSSERDRYQMCLANGLEDTTWEDFHEAYQPPPYTYHIKNITTPADFMKIGSHPNRCILRLIPGIDLLVPDRRLVGGMDADQLVFQVRATIDTTGIKPESLPYLSLWIMFEYCGILTIEPVHANIDMIPIKSLPPITQVDAVADASADNAAAGGEGTGSDVSGAGIFSNIWGALSKLPGLVSRGLRKVADFMNSPQARTARSLVDTALGVNSAPPPDMNPNLTSAVATLGQYARNWGEPDAQRARYTYNGYPVSNPQSALVPTGANYTGGTVIGSGKLGKFYK